MAVSVRPVVRIFLVIVESSGALASKVTITNKEFQFGGSRLFISGANQAWHWYGYDFGDGQYYKDPSRVYQRNIDQGILAFFKNFGSFFDDE